MEKLGVLWLMLSLGLLGLGGCANDVFTSDPLFTGTGEGADAGAAGTAGAVDLGLAGSAPGGGSGAAAGGSGGTPAASAGATGLGGGAAGSAGAPNIVPPCQGAIDAPSHGYLALQQDSCYRTPDVFDTIVCGGIGWAARTIKINGAVAACDETATFPPPIGGYTYIEIDGGEPGADWMRWSESQ